MNIKPEARELYKFLSTVSFDYGLIDIFTLTERYEFLDGLSASSDENEHEYDIVLEERKDLNGNLVLSLTTHKSSSIGCCWHFTLGDPDPKPSIPHGHSQNDRSIVLDSYLGNIYRNRSGIHSHGAEKKSYIIALWNNQKFRDFSTKHIHWFISQNPKYKWRVLRPRILPRRKSKSKP